MANIQEKDLSKPRAIAVAILTDNYAGGEKIRFNILCIDTMKLSIVHEAEIYGILKAGTMNIDNLAIEQNKVVGSNGSIDRLPKIQNGVMAAKPSMTIINEIKDFGYFVSDWHGRTIYMDYEEAVNYAINNGISNGKVVTTADKSYISSIRGSYYLTEKDGKELSKIRQLNMKLRLLEAPYYINYDYGIEITDNHIKTISVIGAKRLGNDTFKFCPNLEEIKIAGKNIVLESGALAQVYNVYRIVLSEGIKHIPENAFEDDRKLRLINIPNSVTKIGAKAFIRCKGLKSIEIPDGVKTIGEGAFKYCEQLEHIKLPSKITKLENNIFEGCKNLKNIELPESITSIEDKAFDSCTSLEKIKLPKDIVRVSNSAFLSCYGLKDIYVPEHLNTNYLILSSNTTLHRY